MPSAQHHKITQLQAMLLLGFFLLLACQQKEKKLTGYMVKKTTDFIVNGAGNADNWKATEWTSLTSLPNYTSAYSTDFKLLYSPKGLYVLFRCSDSLLTNSIKVDRAALYKEDVLELFLQPDTTRSHYFEYELSPLNFETPLLIFNTNGDLNSWQPFEQSEKRKVVHATSVTGGIKEGGAAVSEWTGEFFIPFDLLRPLGGAAPKSGDNWKANLYRIDYDKGEALWAWKLNSGNFHEFQHFGILHFE
jgi:hypothetical protein